MDNTTPPLTPSPCATAPVAKIQAAMESAAHLQLWIWSAGFLVTLLLTIGVASFAFPGLLSEETQLYAFNLNLAVRGLVGLVLLFNVYTVYQQLQIYRIQSSVKNQLDALCRLEDRTEEVYKIAALDSLTGLYNRQSGEQRLAEELLRSQRHSIPLTVLTLDLNELKRINDTFGHPAGDFMLRFFAERLQRAIRGSDIPIRLGGDEFLVLLPECKISEVQLVLNRLTGLAGDFDGHKIPLEFAAGWTDYIPGESSQALMMRADTALYANKRMAVEKRNEKDKEAKQAIQADSTSRGKPPADCIALTLPPREYQVLQLLAQAKSNKEVADVLGISTRTVETYRANILARLNLHSISELILYAVRNNIINIEDPNK